MYMYPSGLVTIPHDEPLSLHSKATQGPVVHDKDSCAKPQGSVAQQ
jgi:hypothetical protein